jgi:SpoVK/Ycf46/Vps4 family AAA+-type ATPase
LNTPGFVGADLMALTREASMVAVNRFVYCGSVTVIV